MLKGVTRSAQLIDQRLAALNQKRQADGQHALSVANYFDHHATDADTQVSVTEDDFMRAKDEMAPSVSIDELRHYERVRDAFEGVAKRPAHASAEEAKSPTKRASQTKELSRPKLNEIIKQAKENGNIDPFVNGDKNTRNGEGPRDRTISNADDDYVVRTDRLTLNEATTRPPSSRGKAKGKGKSRQSPMLDGHDDADAEEDLYD